MVLFSVGVARAGTPINLVQLDPTWATGGQLTVDVGGPGPYEDEPFWLIQQPDGKFVTAGKALNRTTGNFDFAIIRYNPDGTLDSTFGYRGISLIDIDGAYDEGLSVALQPDGKLVIAGRGDHPNGNTDFAIARVLPNGQRDTTFGWNGVVMTDFQGLDDNALAVRLQPDGKIVAAGFATSPKTGSDFAVTRYLPNGSLDPTFGWGGRVMTDFAGKTDAISKMFIQPDGKIVGSGVAWSARTNSYDFGVVRYNTNGSPDTGFGWGGLVQKDFFGGDDVGWGNLLLPDGKILVSGYAFNPATGSNDAALMRLNSNGSLDTTFATFGQPGVVVTDVAGDYDQILWLTQQPDGKILGVGHSVEPGQSFNMALFRYNPDGSLDTTFGVGGHIVLDWFGGPDGLHAAVLTSDGKILAAGDVYHPATQSDDFALARWLIADPSWISGVVNGLPLTSFTATGKQNTLAALATAGTATSTGDAAGAKTALTALRTHIDGCGAAPDGDDWITDCAAQQQVRTLVDQVLAKLGP